MSINDDNTLHWLSLSLAVVMMVLGLAACSPDATDQCSRWGTYIDYQQYLKELPNETEELQIQAEALAPAEGS